MLYSFPSIANFYQIRSAVENFPALVSAPVSYRAKIKLHGTNAGVQVRRTGVVAQSRNAVLGVGQSLNMGFADWVDRNRAFFEALYGGEDFCVFGEWCGPGVMKKAAISKIAQPIWTPFLIRYGEDDDTARVIVEPAALRAVIPPHPDVFVLDWFGEELTIDWKDADQLREVAALGNRRVAEIETRDPFVYDTFGVAGIGEGLVFYPTTVTSLHRMSKLMFKAKGQHHKVVRTREAMQIDPEVVATVAGFADLFVTEARLEQALHAVGGVATMRQIGPFLQWLLDDVRKESTVELAALQMRWADVKRAVQTPAKDWFVALAKRR